MLIRYAESIVFSNYNFPQYCNRVAVIICQEESDFPTIPSDWQVFSNTWRSQQFCSKPPSFSKIAKKIAYYLILAAWINNG